MQIINPTLTPHPDYIADESDYRLALRLKDAFSDRHPDADESVDDTEYRLAVDTRAEYASS